jgi:hypothetical protein
VLPNHSFIIPKDSSQGSYYTWIKVGVKRGQKGAPARRGYNKILDWIVGDRVKRRVTYM